MRRAWLFLLIAGSLQAVTIPTLAGVLSIAASATQIVKEGHNLFTHPLRTLKHHGAQLKDAAKGNAAPVPTPVAVPAQPQEKH